MNKQNLNNKYNFVIPTSLILILILLIGINFYNNRNWNKSDLCINWELQGNSTCSKPTNECNNIEAGKNAWVQECSCQDGNLTQNIICMKKTDVWEYNK